MHIPCSASYLVSCIPLALVEQTTSAEKNIFFLAGAVPVSGLKRGLRWGPHASIYFVVYAGLYVQGSACLPGGWYCVCVVLHALCAHVGDVLHFFSGGLHGDTGVDQDGSMDGILVYIIRVTKGCSVASNVCLPEAGCFLRGSPVSIEWYLLLPRLRMMEFFIHFFVPHAFCVAVWVFGEAGGGAQCELLFFSCVAMCWCIAFSTCSRPSWLTCAFRPRS